MGKTIAGCRKCDAYRETVPEVLARLAKQAEQIDTDRKDEHYKFSKLPTIEYWREEDRADAVAYRALRLWLSWSLEQLQAAQKRLCRDCYRALQASEERDARKRFCRASWLMLVHGLEQQGQQPCQHAPS